MVFRRSSGTPKLHQKFLHRQRAAIAQRQIVLFRSSLVAMAFNDDGKTGIGGQDALDHIGILGQSVAAVGADVVLVVIEINILRFARENLVPLEILSPVVRGGGGGTPVETSMVTERVS